MGIHVQPPQNAQQATVGLAVFAQQTASVTAIIIMLKMAERAKKVSCFDLIELYLQNNAMS